MFHNVQPKWQRVWRRRSCWVLAPPFCLGLQGLFNRSGVELHVETLPNPARQLGRPKFGFGLDQFPKMLAHFRRELVGLFGPGFSGSNPSNPRC